YIAQRRIFQSPLAITPCRLAFEINNQKIFSGKQYLSEVVVAVYPNFGDINFMMVDLLKQLKELVFHIQNFSCFGLHVFGQIFYVATQALKGNAYERLKRGKQGSLVMQRIGLRFKSGQIIFRRKRHVQLASACPQQTYQLGIGSVQQIPDLIGEFFVGGWRSQTSFENGAG